MELGSAPKIAKSCSASQIPGGSLFRASTRVSSPPNFVSLWGINGASRRTFASKAPPTLNHTDLATTQLGRLRCKFKRLQQTANIPIHWPRMDEIEDEADTPVGRPPMAELSKSGDANGLLTLGDVLNQRLLPTSVCKLDDAVFSTNTETTCQAWSGDIQCHRPS